MVKKFSSRKKAPLASLESLISIETCGEENNINCVRWSDQENMDRETDLQTDLETDLDLSSLPWNSPSWQRTSVSRQNCQVYQVDSIKECKLGRLGSIGFVFRILQQQPEYEERRSSCAEQESSLSSLAATRQHVFLPPSALLSRHFSFFIFQ